MTAPRYIRLTPAPLALGVWRGRAVALRWPRHLGRGSRRPLWSLSDRVLGAARPQGAVVWTAATWPRWMPRAADGGLPQRLPGWVLRPLPAR